MFNTLMPPVHRRQLAVRLARRRFLQVVGAATIPIGGTVWAQAPSTSPKLTQILQADLQGQGQKVQETVVNILEMAPAVAAPWHMHPGAQEIIFVLDGAVTVEIEGHAAQEIKAGAIVLIPAEVPHLARNAGVTPARALVTHSRADKESPFLVLLKKPT